MCSYSRYSSIYSSLCSDKSSSYFTLFDLYSLYIHGSYFSFLRQLDPSNSCIELACGDGKYSYPIVSHFSTPVLTDLSIDAVQFVMERFSSFSRETVLPMKQHKQQVSREVLALDETDFVDDADTANPEPLLHLFNHMYSKGGYLLLTAKKPPAAWQLPLPDLMSRLKSLPISEIGLPDDDLLKGILLKMFDDKQVLVNSDLINFIVSRMNRSYGAALEIVERLNKESLSKKRAITIPFVRDVFREWI